MASKEYFDLLIVVPLEEELHEVSKVFRGIRNLSTPTVFRYAVDTGRDDITALMVQQPEMGKASAAKTVNEALAEFDFGLIVCVGIAGCLTGDLNLCDVCYSGTILDVTENAKAEDAKVLDEASESDGDGMKIFLSPTFFDTPQEITAALNFCRTFPELRSIYEDWQADCELYAETLIHKPLLERDGRERKLTTPKSKNGTIACGLVTKSEHYNRKILAVERKTLAIETESGGIFAEAKARGLPCLTIRGISDHADRNKGKLEEDTGANVRRIAASNAAKFLKYQLSNEQFAIAVKKAQSRGQLSLSLADATEQRAMGLTDTVSAISEALDTRLRELSPEYRLQPKGYHLPVPRVREVQYASGIGQKFNSDAMELREALAAEDVVLLSLPRTYPDNSLPFVIAKDLLTAEVDEKQIIPIVIDGRRVRPPNYGLSAAREYPFEVANIPGTRRVYIVDEMPWHSNTRTKLLAEEIRKHSDDKFIIVTRTDNRVVAESEFASSVGASFFHLTGVSFAEIAHFVQKNFEITAAESEVIAFRLRKTFNHFDLSAHPTYFAGIGKEVLTSLLQANRRAELIQLAVDGFLMTLPPSFIQRDVDSGGCFGPVEPGGRRGWRGAGH